MCFAYFKLIHNSSLISPDFILMALWCGEHQRSAGAQPQKVHYNTILTYLAT